MTHGNIARILLRRRAVREELAKSREESIGSGRHLREEIGASVKSLGDSLVKSHGESAAAQKNLLDSFSKQLLVLTESNDIFQALIGRLFGAHKRHRITPTISPNKTWEGFLGGLLVTITLALLLAPWMTDLGRVAGPFDLPEPLRPWIAPLLAALLIAVAGFFGDINMSAIKRDAGVKDSSKLMPGMGGLIDRVDSLTITAPVFVRLRFFTFARPKSTILTMPWLVTMTLAGLTSRCTMSRAWAFESPRAICTT